MNPRLAKRWLRENRTKQPKPPHPFPTPLPPKLFLQEDFLSQLARLLKQVGPLPAYAAEYGTVLLRSHRRKEKCISAEERDHLPRQGPCLNCQYGPIGYGPSLHPSHLKFGESWRQELFEKWAWLNKIERDPAHPSIPSTITRPSWEMVLPYFCASCRERGVRLAREQQEEQRRRDQEAVEQLRQASEKEERRQTLVLDGKVPGSRWEDQWAALKFLVAPVDTDRLREYPYEVFRQTRYWELVRQWAIREAKSRCQQCRRRVTVEVYHRGENQWGYEVWIPVEELDVLCANCGPAWEPSREILSAEEWAQHLPVSGPLGPALALKKRWMQLARPRALYA